jgi:chromosome segregation ATPase
MGLDYKKKSHGGDNESFWTSYSDLFLGLSSIFLMLYVVASLRTGTDTVRVMTDNENLKIEVQELQNTLKTYENMKQNYMQQQASKSEVDEYNELMDKLTLLQADAKEEKDKLRKDATENEKKEMALNKYQQMIKNIINANKLAKVKIENRNDIIVDREDVIDQKEIDIKEKQKQIAGLNSNINNLQGTLQTKEQEIAKANQILAKKMQELKNTFKRAKLSQKAYQAKLKQLQKETQENIQNIQQEKQKVAANLNNMKRTLASTQTELQSKQSQLVQKESELEAKGEEVSNLKNKLGSVQAETQAKIDALKGEHDAEKAAAKAAFENELRKQKNLSAGEIARRESEFAAKSAEKDRKLAGEINGLMGQLKSTEEKLSVANAELAARKNIAQEINKNFKSAGIKADIDMDTGDVVLDFGQTFFDVNSANLKNEMRNVLEKAMPVYSKALFGNPKTAKLINAVEVVGFASPTYQGRVVDPYSNKPQDREAIKYNMDLSYRRARSIFNYILDEKEMNFTHRDQLVPALKVSGRSFLDLMKQDRSIASAEEYCKKHDCKKSQRVIIRFNVDNKK